MGVSWKRELALGMVLGAWLSGPVAAQDAQGLTPPKTASPAGSDTASSAPAATPTAPPPASAEPPPTAPPPSAGEAPAEPEASTTATQPAIPAAPAASGTQSPPAPAEACIPACRAGFVCHQGACVSACNPPCPVGTQCTAQATCAVIGATAGAPAAPAVPPAPADPRVQERERIRRWRKAHLRDPHLTLDGFVRVHTNVEGSDSAPLVNVLAGSAAVGFNRNFAPYAGLTVRAVLSLGGAAARTFEDDTRRDAARTLYYGLEAEVIPYLGPLGAFYLGPMFSVGYHGYAGGNLTATDGDIAPLRDVALFGLGGAFGLFLGERRDIHVHWFIKGTFTDSMPFQTGVALGYRFGSEGPPTL